jgi:hypothetical protein
MIRFLQSIACGALLTGLLLLIAIQSGSETVWCVLMWQACLLIYIVKPGHESPTIFFFVLLGVPIYGLLAYFVFGLFKKRKQNKRLG